jgi:DNA-binding IclR family transcriptional regulator
LRRSRYAIHSLDAALDVIESFLTGKGGARGVTEISRATGLNKSRVFRILDTLAQRGYVSQDPLSLKYSLGPGCLSIGESYRQGLDLSRLAQPILQKLADSSGDTAHLLVLFGDRAITLGIRRGRNFLQASESVGQTFPLYIGCAPKILLANLPERQRTELIEGLDMQVHTEHTTPSREALVQELSVIREQGYWIVKDDYEAGIYAVGAAVRDQSGRVVAGISLTTPHARHSEERERENTRLVIEAARELSAALGFRGERGSVPRHMDGEEPSSDADAGEGREGEG